VAVWRWSSLGCFFEETENCGGGCHNHGVKTQERSLVLHSLGMALGGRLRVEERIREAGREGPRRERESWVF